LESVFTLKEPLGEPLSARDISAAFVMMFHGTLVSRHGLHIAIEAVAKVRSRIPGLQFCIYGQETAYLTKEVMPLVAALGLQSQVHYFGEQPQAVIARAVAACDLGVVPNLRTVFTEINLPTRIFEYLALGKPVIVPETRGIRDYFDADSMLFFKGGDVESLAAQIQRVFDHPEKTQAVIREGQKVYRRHLWKEEERRLLRLIAGLVRKSP
jgi:glycosyltransferase involved in cell wall biosynthesis